MAAILKPAFRQCARAGQLLLRFRNDAHKCVLNSSNLKFRQFQTTAKIFGLDDDFLKAKDKLNTLSEDPGNETKLQIYALFKQATEGKCNKPKPGMMDFVGKFKWEAWTKLGDMSKDDAKSAYINLVDELAGAEPQTAASSTDSGSKFNDILVSKEDKMYTITLNRPQKYNAITVRMYNELQEALKEASEDKSTSITVITGAGDYYCSGNDLGNFAVDPSKIGEIAKQSGELLRNYVACYIDHKKPLIGVINGPAVGISVTVLGLFDAVFATDKATFNAPFTVLGQSPEGCSSYVFPKIMGNVKANEILLFNRKLTAQDAYERNLITEIIPHESFQEEVWKKVKGFAQLPPQSLSLGKNIVRDSEREKLHAVNKAECDLLVERWQSKECMKAIMDFFSRKSK